MNAVLRRHLWEQSLRFRGAGRSSEYLRRLEEWQWLGREEVLALKRKRLSELLEHASRHVPYYSDVLGRAGVVDEQGRVRLEAFHNVPLLDKATIRANFERLCSDDLERRKWHYNTSGGSTGEPVRLIQDGDYWDWGIAVKRLYDGWTGYSVGLPKIVLWGSERDLFHGKERTVVRVGRWLKNEVWLNTFRMTPEGMLRYAQQVNACEPVQVLAYVESIYQLARFAEREGIEMHSPRAVMTSAGTLQPHMREVIERVFRAPVFNRYGSREVGDPACECEQGSGLHVSVPTHYVEILRPDGKPAEPGEVGELVVTLLTNHAMPLVRYRIGDMAAWAAEPCPCGRGFPLLEKVVGRTNSMIRTRSQTFDSAAISSLLYYKDAARTQVFGSFSKYQFVQKTLDLMSVSFVVVDGETWPQERAVIQRKLKAAFGDDVEIRIEEVDDIPPSRSGKYAFIMSELEE